MNYRAALAKNKLITRCDGYIEDARVALDCGPDLLTQTDARVALRAAQLIIETLSVWIAIDKGDVA